MQDTTQDKGTGNSSGERAAQSGERDASHEQHGAERVPGTRSHGEELSADDKSSTAVAETQGRVRELVTETQKIKHKKLRELTRREEGETKQTGETKNFAAMNDIYTIIIYILNSNTTKNWAISILGG